MVQPSLVIYITSTAKIMHRAGVVHVGILALLMLPCGETAIVAQTTARGATAAASRPVRMTTGWILGTAWKGDTTPYPQGRIRLRNVRDGRGIATTISDAEGRFRFDDVEPNAYVVELLSNDDKVLAVGELFGVNTGAQSVTVVRLTSKAPWYGGFWGNASAAVLAAASTLGVTANGSSGRPVSPQ